MTDAEKIEAIRKLTRYEMEQDYDYDGNIYHSLMVEYTGGDLLKYDQVMEILNS